MITKHFHFKSDWKCFMRAAVFIVRGICMLDSLDLIIQYRRNNKRPSKRLTNTQTNKCLGGIYSLLGIVIFFAIIICKKTVTIKRYIQM